MKLLIQTVLGFLNLFLILSLSLFLSAGTLNYPQAWVYLFIFFFFTFAITIYLFLKDKKLLESRLKVGPISEQRVSQKIIQSLASVGFVGMYFLAGLDFRFQWSSLPEYAWMISDIFLSFIFLYFFWIFKSNPYLSAAVEIQSNQQTITYGPYRFVRHPMYLAACLFFIFTPLALGSYIVLLLVPFLIGILVARILDEEKLLKEKLVDYNKYCEKTPYRLFPFIW